MIDPERARCDKDEHIALYTGAPRSCTPSDRLVADQCLVMDGSSLPHRICIGGNRARHFWCWKSRNALGLAGDCEVVLSPLLAGLHCGRDGKAIRAAL